MKRSRFDVAYLTIDSIQEGVGSSQITPLVIGLAAQGKKVCLITFEKAAPSQDLVELMKKSGVVWKPRQFGRVGSAGGIVRLVELRRNVPDANVLHGRSDIPAAAAIWSRVQAPVLWDVRSLWSDQRQLIGTAGWNSITARGARSLENVSASHAKAMTTLTAAVVPILQTRHRRLPSIREVIPTCVQTSKFVPSAMPSGEMVCLLSGTFNNYYDIDRTRQIIEAIRKDIDLKVIWARAGESPDKHLGVGEDLVVGAKHSEMPDLVKKAHFGMAICKEDDLGSLAAAVPTKIGEFLASGRPMIVSKGIGDMDTLFRDSRAGLVISKDSPMAGIAARIQTLVADPDVQARCRNLAMDHFDMEKAISTYSSVYEKMMEE
jgi:glycosyltransferase involved in cell wall biosynthesis